MCDPPGTSHAGGLEGVVEVHPAEALARPRLPHGGAQGADDRIDGEVIGGPVQVLKIDNDTLQPCRIDIRKGPPGEGHNPAALRLAQEELDTGLTNESCGAEEENGLQTAGFLSFR
jgi:hypothetical protein